MDLTELEELEASAETELRDAVLCEFLKPGMPVEITLLRHCERYFVRMFDIHAQMLLSRKLEPIDYDKCLENMVQNLPAFFFGCQGAAPHLPTGQQGMKGTRVTPGCTWGRCVEFAMIARVDHGPEPRPSEDEVLGRYLDLNGHFYLTYPLRTRAKVWTSKARSAGQSNLNSPSAVPHSAAPREPAHGSGHSGAGSGVAASFPDADNSTASGPHPLEDHDLDPLPASERAALVDDFLGRCNREAGLEVELVRKHISLAVGHKYPRQFQYWQACDPRATASDNRNFGRILRMTPAEFVKVLTDKHAV